MILQQGKYNMELKLYTSRMSEPSRAIILFCKLNGIDFEEINIDMSKRVHFTPEYSEINPLKQLPAIVHGKFKLSESHTILIYLACAFPGIADHWYPTDIFKRAKIHSVLDWNHSNLRRGSVSYIINSTLGPSLGFPLNPKAAIRGKKLLLTSLSKIESIWLKGNGRFLLGNVQPSIADIRLVCELMQLELLDDKDREHILSPHKRVQEWIEDTKNACKPHFDEVHSFLFDFCEKFKLQRSETCAVTEITLHSKM